MVEGRAGQGHEGMGVTLIGPVDTVTKRRWEQCCAVLYSRRDGVEGGRERSTFDITRRGC